MPYRDLVAYNVWLKPPKKAGAEAKACRKQTTRRLVSLVGDADIRLLKASCRDCRGCWLADT